jgi:uncharacterized membrane protein
MDLSVHLLILSLSLGASIVAPFALQVLRRNSWSRLWYEPSRRVADYAFYVLAIAYVVVFSTLSILQHLSFANLGYDLAIFDQVVWNSLHGRLFETTLLTNISSLLQQRFPPILLAFVPLYTVWSSPIVLLIVQTVGIAIAAFPLYWVARVRVGYTLALVIVLAYFLCPALQGVNLFEFHEVALSIPLFSFASFFLLRRMYKPMLICLGLTLLAKEEMAVVLIAFGIFILLMQSRVGLGMGISLFGVLWGVLLLQYLIPYFNGSPLGTGSYYYFGNGVQGQGRYEYLGQSLFAIMTTLVTRPLFVLQNILVPAKIEYVLDLLVPVAFLPLLGAEIGFLAFPTLGISLLSNLSAQFSIKTHYSAAILPFLFFAMVIGLGRMKNWVRLVLARQTRIHDLSLAVLVLMASGQGYYYLAPGPLSKRFDPNRYVWNSHIAAGHSIFAEIPKDAAVIAQLGLIPHLSERRGIYELSSYVAYCQAEYFVADTQSRYYLNSQALEAWFASGFIEPVAWQDGYVVAKRRGMAYEPQIRFGNELTLLSWTLPYSDTLHGSQQFCPTAKWRVEGDIYSRRTVQTTLIDDQGHVFLRDIHELQDGLSAVAQLVNGQVVKDQFAVRVLPTVPSGRYRVLLSIYDPSTEQFLVARDPLGQNLGEEVVIATVQIEKDKSSHTASELFVEQPYFVDMQEIRLLGYVGLTDRATIGSQVSLGIYWRARGKPRGDYEVAVQLRDPAGRVALAQSSRPADGAYPTTLWETGEVLLDWHDLVIAGDFPVGEYAMMVVLRDAVSKAVIGEAPVSKITIGK